MSITYSIVLFYVYFRGFFFQCKKTPTSPFFFSFRMSQIFSERSVRNLIFSFICLFLQISLYSSIILHEINQAIFLNPTTNAAVVRCPLNSSRGADIQWYDALQQRYEQHRGRYYRIHGLQPFHRELICSSIVPVTNNDNYKFILRIYGKKPFWPLCEVFKYESGVEV